MQKSHLGRRHCTAKCCRRKLLGGLHTPFPRAWLTPTCRRNDSLGRRRCQPASKIDRLVWKATDRTALAGGEFIGLRPVPTESCRMRTAGHIPAARSEIRSRGGTRADRQTDGWFGRDPKWAFPSRLSSKESATSATNWLAKTG